MLTLAIPVYNMESLLKRCMVSMLALYAGIRRLLDDPALLAHYRVQAEVRGKTFSAENTVRAVEEMLCLLG